MSVEEKRRELFEAWDSDNRCFRLCWENGSYVYATTQREWSAFNADLDAVVIELPPSLSMPDEDECDGYEEYEAMEAITCTANGVRRACRAAIESTGLGLKVLP